jgi:hypothetical protein
MRKIILIGIALVVAGCATPRGPEVYEGNASSVIVGWNNSTQGSTGALQAADQHCAQYGKTARYSGKPNDFLLAYDCIK